MKHLSMLVVLLLVFGMISSVQSTNLIAAKKEVDVEKAILRVREIFDIPVNFDKVDTDIYEDEIIINWGYKDSESDEYIRAVVTKDGVITSYNAFLEADGVKIKLSGAKNRAKKLLNKIYGNKDFEFYELYLTGSRDNYRITYGLKIKDIPVYGAAFSMEYSKNTGNLTSYDLNANAKFISNANIKNFKPKKTKSEAYDAILTDKEMVLILKKLDEKYHPYYALKDDKPIVDANTLDLIKQENEYDGVYKAEEAARDSTPKLSPAEKKEIDKIKGLKSAKEAEAKVRNLFNIPKSFKLANSSLISNDKSRYIYQMSLSNDDNIKYASIDAMDLMPISYHEYSGENKVKADEAKSLAKSEEFLKKIGIKDHKLYQTNSSKYGANFLFMRDLNGYLVEDDTVSFSYEGDRLVSFNYNRILDKIEYPSKKIEAKDVKNLFKRDDKLELFIYPVASYDELTGARKLKEFKLVYSFNYRAELLDAVTGKFMTDLGEDELFKPTGDTKLDINEIVELGAGVASNKSYQDPFSYEDLLKSYSKLNWGYIDKDAKYIIKRYDGLKYLKDVDLKKSIKAEEMAKILVILKHDFNDDSLKDEFFLKLDGVSKGYNGYVAIARSLGWNNNQAWNKEITVEEALLALQRLY
ncbi:MAG: hypothetical protein SOZ40_06450 [Ezakiella sp.]|nr:hypothetical protein [Ezakiella sp.]